MQLNDLASRINLCKNCGLYKSRKNCVICKGSETPRVVFVGEAPGAREDELGLPFVGRSGAMLDEWMNLLGVENESAVINVVKCRPPGNRKPTRIEIETCRPFMDEQLRLMEPKLVITLGAVATEAILGAKKPMSEFVGRKFESRDNTHAVLPMFHPAYFLRRGQRGRAEIGRLGELMRQLNLPQSPPIF